MKRILLLNIGNTHTQWGWGGSDGDISDLGECETAVWLDRPALLPESCDTVWAASVVPEARRKLAAGFYPDLHWVEAATAMAAGVNFHRVDTTTLGADRIANAAALLDYPLPAAAFDCGTAVTLEMVDASREFAGGAIAPGRRLWRRALAAGTAALPELELRSDPPEDLGRNTLDALALGIDRGAVGMVREWIDVARRHGAVTLIACGGDADFFARVLPDLRCGGRAFTLRGILKIALANRP